jgi:hypothetical protein
MNGVSIENLKKASGKVNVTCNDCSHTSSIKAEDLGKSPDKLINELKFVCAACRSKDIRVEIYPRIDLPEPKAIKVAKSPYEKRDYVKFVADPLGSRADFKKDKGRNKFNGR